MRHVVLSILAIIVGSVLIAFWDEVSRFAMRGQNRFWGFNFGKEAVAVTKGFVLVLGIVLVFFGIMYIVSYVAGVA